MTCFFATETLTRLTETRADIKTRFDTLQTALLSRKFKSRRAEEYARHGLGRRLDEMNRAIDFIFDILLRILRTEGIKDVITCKAPKSLRTFIS